MVVVHSRNGVPIRLTPERRAHITERHPEMASQQERALETIAEPDIIQDYGNGKDPAGTGRSKLVL